jgi:hypothetical protein
MGLEAILIGATVASVGMGAATAAGAFTPDVQTPTPRNLSAEALQTWKTETELAPERYAMEQEYQPLYDKLARKQYRDQLLGTGPDDPGQLALLENVVMPSASRLQAKSDAAQRNADISAIEQLGPRATAAYRNANPEQAALLNMMNDQVAGDMAMGGKLSAVDARRASEGVRAAQAVRGFGAGPKDALEEALALQLEGDALKQRRFANAQDMVRMNQSTTVDPFMAILGKPSGAQNYMGTAMNAAQATTSGGPRMSTDPLSNQYASDLYNTNYNGAAAANIAQSNLDAAMLGTGIKTLGSGINTGVSNYMSYKGYY